MSPHICEIMFLAPIIATASYHAHRFNNHVKTGQLFHMLWSLVFGALIVFMCWLMYWNYILAAALVLERFVFFNPLLNFFRRPRKPFFYINSEKNGSWLDRVLTKVYKPVWVAGLAGLIILQFFL